MKEYQSLSHTRWDCKYHLVFISKKRTSFNQEIGQMRFDAANGQHPGYLR